MRPTMLLAFIASFWLSSGSYLSAGDSKPLTPAEEYRALVKALQDGQKAYGVAYKAAKTEEEKKRASDEFSTKASPHHYVGKFVELIRNHPRDNAALDAFRWIVSYLPAMPEAAQAVEVLIKNRIEDERLADVCKFLGRGTCDSGDTLLRAAIAKSPHRAVQGFARYSLARSLKHQTISQLAHAGPAARARYEQEAERLLQEVVDKYADLKDETTLGKAAEKELFEIRHLGIGKIAPEIEGEDLDGKAMKLGDFRGKIVLLNFWDTTCGACIADVPEERALVKRLEGKPFVLLGINTDKSRQKAQKVVAKEGIIWRSWWDHGKAEDRIAVKWNVSAWPTLYLLDAKGVIRFKGQYLRATTFREDKAGNRRWVRYLDEAVDDLLKELEGGGSAR
ncbi:MAG: TlpA family protein disulfide reductase [Planctomycetes bacterium]|nr:TlpA family protein disulfide reductase [Planctomycetota bacterium]